MYLLLLGSALASSDPATGGDPQLNQCLAAAQGIAPVRSCYQSAFARVDLAITQQIVGLPARLPAGKVPPALVSEGEAAWKAYRDKWCTFEEAAERDAEARATTGLQCRVEISLDHLARLKEAF
jgi:uncharacterized protein YecT (DUF1311 family)